jgi:hypothetical protein
MSKKIDIDTILADDALEITLGGKTYVVSDVKMDVFLKASRANEDDENLDGVFQQLADILGAEVKDLDIGLRAAGIALKKITEWIYEVAPEQDDVDTEELKQGNP